jgi:branched-chain amino acid transport system ATP-binding protein
LFVTFLSYGREIKRARGSCYTVLLAGQNVFVALSYSNWAYVLEEDRITMTGTGEELLGNEHIKKAYLDI